MSKEDEDDSIVKLTKIFSEAAVKVNATNFEIASAAASIIAFALTAGSRNVKLALLNLQSLNEFIVGLIEELIEENKKTKPPSN